jgi:hypothetical protein
LQRAAAMLAHQELGTLCKQAQPSTSMDTAR